MLAAIIIAECMDLKIQWIRKRRVFDQIIECFDFEDDR